MADTRIDELRQRLERDPGSRLFAQLAEELRKAGDVDEAISIARAGLAVHPSYPSARLTLGRALLDAGDAAAAKAELETAVRGAPDNILASRVLAEAHEALGDVSAALAQYRGTLEMAPGDVALEARVRALQSRLLGVGGGPSAGTSTQAREATEPTSPGQAPQAGGAGVPEVRVGPDGKLPPTVRIQMPADPRGEPRAPLPPTTEAGGVASEVAGPPTPARETAEEEPLPPTLSLGARTTEVRAEPPPVVVPRGEPVPGGGARERPAFRTDTADVGEVAEEVTGAAGRPVEVLDGVEDRPGAPVAGAEGSSPVSGAGVPDPTQTPLSSATLGELYLKQGLVERAVEVFRQVLEEEPGNDAVRRRLAEIEKVTRESAADLPVPPSDEGDERAVRRRALEGAIERLEALLAVVRRGR